MSSSFCISLAKPTPVHFQYCIPDRRTNSGYRPHKTGVAFCRNLPTPKLSGSIVLLRGAVLRRSRLSAIAIWLWGIPHTIPEHLNRMAEAALQMLDEATQVRAPGGTKLAIRIGIHTGPVCAGVIGESKFIFDVWGDTVNMASRMESHGAAGRIQVTEAVHTALLGKYDFVGPMTINVKGKGPSQTWFLSGRRSLYVELRDTAAA